VSVLLRSFAFLNSGHGRDLYLSGSVCWVELGLVHLGVLSPLLFPVSERRCRRGRSFFLIPHSP